MCLEERVQAGLQRLELSELARPRHAFLLQRHDFLQVAIRGAYVGFDLRQESLQFAGRHVLVRRRVDRDRA